MEPPRKKRESTPLSRVNSTMTSGGTRTAIKVGASNSTRPSEYSGSHTGVQPYAMTWTSTWEVMNRTLDPFAKKNTDSIDRGSGKSRKTFKKPKEFKDDSDGCIDTWVEVMRLHLEQDNLNDERLACTAILSNLEGTALKCVVARKEKECGHCRQDIRDTVESIWIGYEGSSGHDEVREKSKEMTSRLIDVWMILRAWGGEAIQRNRPTEET